jgi:Fanconi anemia group M protein
MQHENIKILFGKVKVLVATSVGEEGLDVPSTDMVIFYEAVPSEIRSIQRKGRTGRSGSGNIVVSQ